MFDLFTLLPTSKIISTFHFYQTLFTVPSVTSQSYLQTFITQPLDTHKPNGCSEAILTSRDTLLQPVCFLQQISHQSE
jgi:hypothetical protein